MNTQDKLYRERYMNREPEAANRITITATGRQGCGKTSLLMILLDMMADAGLLSHSETKGITADPKMHFAECRVMNADAEAIEVMVDVDALLASRRALESFRVGETGLADVPIRNHAHMEFDGALLAAIGPDASRQVIQQDIGGLILAIQESGHPVLPLTITIDEA